MEIRQRKLMRDFLLAAAHREPELESVRRHPAPVPRSSSNAGVGERNADAGRLEGTQTPDARSFSRVRIAPEDKRGWGGEYGRLERLDVDPINDPYRVDAKRKPVEVVNTHQQVVISSKEAYAWILTAVTGIAVAIIARFMQLCIDALCRFRNQRVQTVIESYASRSAGSHPTAAFTEPFVFFAVWNLGFALVGGVLTAAFEPHTAADGIAEIKAFINGTHVKHFLRLRTIVAKVVGTILAASSGLAAGSEGPLIHIGAGVGSGLTRGDKMRHSFIEFSPAILGLFHNDRDRREFVSAGAAAGMAAAFGSPVGGVLWVLEETSSAWTPALIWRMFTAALLASVTLAFLKAGIYSGDISVSGLLSFGNIRAADAFSLASSSVASPIYWWETLLFALVGAAGGLLGAIWNKMVKVLARVRPRSVLLRVLEVLLVSLITSCSILALVLLPPACRNNGLWTCRDAGNWGAWCTGPADAKTCIGPSASCANATAWVCQGGRSSGRSCRDSDCEPLGGTCVALSLPARSSGVQLLCAPGQYDEMATLLWGHHEDSIVRILTQAWPASPFAQRSLLQAGGLTFVLVALTFGTHISTGILMPLVFVGSCLGRAAGEYFKEHVDGRIFAGGYALAGAAALLAGVQRASISLVIILIEGTSNVHSLLPVVTAICASNLVGSLVGGDQGIYDIMLHRKRLRFLEHQPSSLTGVCFVGDVMTRPVVTLRAVEKVATIVEVLRRTPHHGFPVVSVGARDMPMEAGFAPNETQGQRRQARVTALEIDKDASEIGICEEQGGDGNSAHRSMGACLDHGIQHCGGVPTDCKHGPDEHVPAAAHAQGGGEPGRGGQGHGEGEGQGRLEGIILRSTLRVLLAARFDKLPAEGEAAVASAGGRGGGAKEDCVWDSIAARNPRGVALSGHVEIYEQLGKRRYTGESKRHARTWEWASFTDDDMQQYINLAPYMNASPYRVAETCLLDKAYGLFQHMNLRHLPVVDHRNAPVGMIARENLTKALVHKTSRTYLRKSDLNIPRARFKDVGERAGGNGYGATHRMLALGDRLGIPLATRPSSCLAAAPSTSMSLSSTLMPHASSTCPAYFTGGPLGSWQQRLVNVLGRRGLADLSSTDVAPVAMPPSGRREASATH